MLNESRYREPHGGRGRQGCSLNRKAAADFADEPDGSRNGKGRAAALNRAVADAARRNALNAFLESAFVSSNRAAKS